VDVDRKNGIKALALCSLKDLRLVTHVLLAISPGTDGLTLSPLEDQD
jgi:hypothetical protein